MLPLEDGFADIIGKAQRGLKLSDEVLCREAGVSGEDFQRVKGGDFNEEIVRKLAEPLRLAPDRLVALGSWHPNIAHPSNLARVTTPFDGGTVNAYLIWDEETKEAALFDTGMDAGPLLQAVRDRGLTPKYIFVTHTHSDHIAELPNLARATGLTPLVHESQDIGGVRLFKWGQTFPLGKLKVETRRTTGHAEGGPPSSSAVPAWTCRSPSWATPSSPAPWAGETSPMRTRWRPTAKASSPCRTRPSFAPATAP